MRYKNYTKRLTAFLLLLLPFTYIYSQNFQDIRPVAILTDPIYNSELKYKKLVKSLDDTIVEIKQFDSSNRLVFWYRKTQAERISKLRCNSYTYNAKGKLLKQYFFEKVNHVVWEYVYDTVNRVTRVYQMHFAVFLPENVQNKLHIDLKDELQSINSNYSETIQATITYLDSIFTRNDTIKRQLLFEALYDNHEHETQIVKFSTDGDTQVWKQSLYNTLGQLSKIRYRIGKNTFITHNFIYEDSGRVNAHLLQVDQWHYSDAYEKEPLSLHYIYFLYDDSGRIQRNYEVVYGELNSDEQYTYDKNGKLKSATHYTWNMGDKKETISYYTYDSNKLLSKCIVRNKKGKSKKKVFRYEYVL